MSRLPPPPIAEPTLEEMFGEGLMTTEEARAYLNVAESTLDALIYNGAIASVKVGKSRRIPKKAMATYLQSRMRKSEAKAPSGKS